ncbi:leech-derived tryptase inhibitor C-like [Drosophila albomicans]|uniref:Leech-derived tryptase inhibitor C-like n=1 Tax=Drosophila albomicans TaxID=7291 RepID=A0A6P8W4Q3_DROAB|nr:leech-derived tryptase inhibitor C-like [Drosophila albomicans]
MRFLALFTLCLLALVALSTSTEPAAEPFCACPRNLDWVCGSDNRSYPNACELGCSAQRQGRSLSVARKGQC